jgi:hypothetical protein
MATDDRRTRSYRGWIMAQTSSFFELAALLIPVLMLSGFARRASGRHGEST